MARAYLRTDAEILQLWLKRQHLFCDYIKTLCFGFIGAAVLAPTFRHDGALGLDAYVVILVASVFLSLMLWFADLVR